MDSESRGDDRGDTIDALRDECAQLHSRLRHLETIATAVRAAIPHGEPGYRARNAAAAAALRRLLELPGTRSGSWEPAPVTKLEDELRGILDELTGDAA